FRAAVRPQQMRMARAVLRRGPARWQRWSWPSATRPVICAHARLRPRALRKGTTMTTKTDLRTRWRKLHATALLHELGQSLWLDNITRDLLERGTLKRYVDELSVTGLTSNPTIFE